MSAPIRPLARLRRVVRHTLVSVTVAALTSACLGGELGDGGDAGVTPPEGSGPDVQDFPLVLGTGEQEFVALDDGDPLLLVLGFQGLQHVAASVRVWDIPEDRYPVAVELVRTTDSAPVAEPANTRVPLVSAGADYLELVGLRAVVEVPADIVGQEARLRVTVSGPDGLSSAASHVGVVEWAPGDG